MNLQQKNRELWLWLLQQPTPCTARTIALQMGATTDEAIEQLAGLCRRKLVERVPPAQGEFRLRYAVTGNCLVPQGISVAEAQA